MRFKFALIGRDSPGKNIQLALDIIVRARASNFDLEVFSNITDCEILDNRINYHGWIPSSEVWNRDFDYVILPMTAPETFSLVLHESAKMKKKVILNLSNESLTSQLTSVPCGFLELEDLSRVIDEICCGYLKVPEVAVKEGKTRNMWKRLM